VAGLGLPVSRDQAAALARYLKLVASWNTRLRLTAARSAESAGEVLILRTLGVLPHVPREGALVDLGSGGGVPGVPIAVLRPHLRVLLTEAARKKAGFLEIVVRDLRLSNVEVVNMRAEALGRAPEHRELYDVVTAQALAPLRVLVEYALPLLRPGGLAVFPKGQNAMEEVTAASSALRLIGGRAEVHGPPSPHVSPVILVRKVATTPSEYPRRPGVPSRRPL
jgi:16S rRNA (guanine527-N7)-methyltransferase